MDSFLRLYKLYYAISVWSILKPVYFGRFQFGLWASLTALLVSAGSLIYLRAGLWVTIPFCLVAWVWMSQHFKAVELHYERYYSVNKDRLDFYGKDYQYLRYCVFQEKLIEEQFLGNLDDAIAHVEVELETEVSTVISSHPFLAGGMALLFGIVGGSVGAWKAETTILTVAWLFVIVVIGYMFLSASKTPSIRLKEFKRFLCWLRADAP